MYGNKLVNTIKTNLLCISSSNSIDCGGHRSNLKVRMGIIDECGVRGDATFCIVIF